MVVGTGKWASSTGAYRGGVSKGSPSVVSLDAQTTRDSPSWTAARKTFWLAAVLRLSVREGVARPGAGMLARWTAASQPASASTASP